MGKKTIYVRDEDEPLWERAKALAGDESLSAFIAQALQVLIEAKEVPGMEQLVVDEWIDGRPYKKAFWGRWLVRSYVTLRDGTWSVALTRRNRFVFYRHPSVLAPYAGRLIVVDHFNATPADVPQEVLKALLDNLPASFVLPLDI
jgi:hypothetical protein